MDDNCSVLTKAKEYRIDRVWQVSPTYPNRQSRDVAKLVWPKFSLLGHK